MNLKEELRQLFPGLLIEALPEEAIQKWNEWKEEEALIQARVEEWGAETERKEKEKKDLRREKNFGLAFDRLALAGYEGRHGSYPVPEEVKARAMRLYDEVRLGQAATWSPEEWTKHLGMSEADAQRAFIRRVNEIVTKYGWNPSEAAV
uniref:Prophage protein n=1 Tax=Panagrellus redivivus TaxID=6233 RepID=A0A7E4ZWJ7_PANRE